MPQLRFGIAAKGGIPRAQSGFQPRLAVDSLGTG